MTHLFSTRFALLGLMFLFTLTACNKDEGCDAELLLDVDQAQLEADIEAIDAYLAERSIQAEVHPSGLRYVIINEGSGKSPNLCSRVSTAYEGKLMSNGYRFDRTGTPISFPLSNVIKGWQIGLPLIKTTGRIHLYIPSVYGYGTRGSGDEIPPNANLFFDVTLTDIN